MPVGPYVILVWCSCHFPCYYCIIMDIVHFARLIFIKNNQRIFISGKCFFFAKFRIGWGSGIMMTPRSSTESLVLSLTSLILFKYIFEFNYIWYKAGGMLNRRCVFATLPHEHLKVNMQECKLCYPVNINYVQVSSVWFLVVHESHKNWKSPILWFLFSEVFVFGGF